MGYIPIIVPIFGTSLVELRVILPWYFGGPINAQFKHSVLSMSYNRILEYSTRNTTGTSGLCSASPAKQTEREKHWRSNDFTRQNSSRNLL